MATLNTTGVIACMFQDDVTITIGAETYALAKNTAIGIPDGVNSLTVSVATKALCMTQQPKSAKVRPLGQSEIQVLFANEIRDVA